MTYTPFQAPLLSQLLGDDAIAAHFSIRAELAEMLRFEAELAAAQADAGIFSHAIAETIARACSEFDPDIPAIGNATGRDGVCVPELVRQLRTRLDDAARPHLHHAATSQDVIDTAFVLRMKKITQILLSRIEKIIIGFDTLKTKFGINPLMARTRMQAARMITAENRINAWQKPLNDHLQRFDQLSPRLFKLQYSGAVGRLEELQDKAAEVKKNLAKRLDLGCEMQAWHTDRSGLVEFSGWLSLVAGTLGKFGQDVALMAQNEIGEIALSEVGGSSAMAHKRNPVRAEILVTLARFAAIQAGGMHQAQLHEQERSGSAWTLEWMLMPQLCVATGAATRTALDLIRSINALGRV
jgi:3-carboxy-cis,cis-muconate cycloisomerase